MIACLRKSMRSLLHCHPHPFRPHQFVCWVQHFWRMLTQTHCLITLFSRSRNGTAFSNISPKEEPQGGKFKIICHSPPLPLAICLPIFEHPPGYLSRWEGVYHLMCSSWGPALPFVYRIYPLATLSTHQLHLLYSESSTACSGGKMDTRSLLSARTYIPLAGTALRTSTSAS